MDTQSHTSRDVEHMRADKDALGEVSVPATALWSAQTQRSVTNFPFGELERQPLEVVKALAVVKQASAMVNKEAGRLEAAVADAIIAAASRVLAAPEAMMSSFPLVVFQTGSGTHSNMNMNEVLANMASVSLGGELGKKAPVHPNDHVNKGQSSNDVFPSAMHIATVLALRDSLKPAVSRLRDLLQHKSDEYMQLVKIGRTHLMDAVPMTLGQELSAYVAALDLCLHHIKHTETFVKPLALGGTAVGTGLNSFPGFAEAVAKKISDITGAHFESAPNKFLALSSVTPMVCMSGALAALATTLLKMANDIRLLGSGPRSGLGELILPSNEPGSSIMPGKVNPSQCESLAMVCTQVIGCNQTVLASNGFGHLQLNVFLPVVASNVLRSIRLLSVGMTSFAERCLLGMQPNNEAISAFVSRSLMLVTALVPHCGYDMAAKCALNAHEKGITLKESVVALNVMTADEFDQRVNPRQMTNVD